ncbi:MAG TPA: glycosyltransferase [Solirubrobacteraceae bacterium]|nr:glycosyltransferase [Solirubrobacteraceae bacterium]
MRVLFLQQQPCVRALKYAAGLNERAPEVALGFAYRGRTLSELYGGGDELFEGWWPLGRHPAAALPGILEEFAPDVIHSHNLPDELTALALDETAGRIPVIHDVHDMQSLRRTPYEDGFPEPADPLALERRAAEESDAVVTVSPELAEALAARYRLPRRVVVYANYALACDLPRALPRARARGGPPRIVYQGTLSANGGHYDLRELFTEIAAQGLSLDVYPARDATEYRSIRGIRLHETLPAADLLRELVDYDFGWAGFNAALNGPHLDTALPNKLFEYLACGLPVITLGHRALRRMLREEGLGIALDRVEDLASALAAADEGALRHRVAVARERFTVEHQIDRIAALYREVAGAVAGEAVAG